MRQATKAALLAAGLALGLPLMAAAEGHTSDYVGAKGYVGEKGYVPAADYHAPVKVRVHKVRRPVRVVALPPCPVNYTGFYRGTLFCRDGKLVP
jgi:uncharacterized membrane protein YphA (DoxX/SURF4 family)